MAEGGTLRITKNYQAYLATCTYTHKLYDERILRASTPPPTPHQPDDNSIKCTFSRLVGSTSFRPVVTRRAGRCARQVLTSPIANLVRRVGRRGEFEMGEIESRARTTAATTADNDNDDDEHRCTYWIIGVLAGRSQGSPSSNIWLLLVGRRATTTAIISAGRLRRAIVGGGERERRDN